MILKGISIPRDDFFSERKENPYASQRNTEKLRAIGINEELIRPFLLSLSKATSQRHMFDIFLSSLFFLLFSLLLVICVLTVDDTLVSTFVLIDAYIGLIFFIVILRSLMAHRRMLRRARHIIDMENRRQNTYKFSISNGSLSLDIARYSDTERGLVQLSSDSLLKELYTVPDYLRDRTLSHFRLIFMRGNTFFDAAVEEILKTQKALKCAFLAFYLPMLFLYVFFLVYMVGDYRNYDMGYGVVIIGWLCFIFVGIVLIRLIIMKRLYERMVIRNEEFKNQGVYFDLDFNTLYIYVFQPFDVIASYKTDPRTSKYFN
jgi:hypothetical protein